MTIKLLLKIAGALTGLVLLAIVSAIILFWAVYFGAFGKLPTIVELADIQNHTASQVYTSDSVLIGKYFVENRTNVKLDHISPAIINALIATEDVRFYGHDGVDPRSLMRVFFKSILLGDRSSGGGSTLSQQLVKNLYPRKSFWLITMPINKIKESILAIRLENIYDKKQLLTLYLNTVSFGEEIYGIESASRRFFSQEPSEINAQEAAVLIGVLKATNYYNPRINPENAIKRRNVVLRQMARNNFLKMEELDSLQSLPLALQYNKITHETGLAPYFREKLRLYLEGQLKQCKKEDGSEYNLYTDGLIIYVPLHSKMQHYAEQAVSASISNLQKIFDDHWRDSKPWDKEPDILQNYINSTMRYRNLSQKKLDESEILKILNTPVSMEVFQWDEDDKQMEMSPIDSIKHYLMTLHAGFIAMEPHTGYIRAWVGGIDYRFFKYDHIEAKRQIGSTFKPIVYAAALENGINPCKYISNEQMVYEEYDDWSPKNSNGLYEGKYSMQGAMTHSVNTVAVELIMQTGIEKVISIAKQLGIESNIPEVPSIALGTAGISLYEMLEAYSVFANRGIKVDPVLVLSVSDKYGHPIFESTPQKEPKRALSQKTTDIVVHFLQSVVDSGTATDLRHNYKLHSDIAGKTGTTQSHADGWFLGFTPDLVAGAWVGADDPSIHFNTITYGQGSKMALPIWALFMQQLYADPLFTDMQTSIFPPLSKAILKELDCPMYKDDNFLQRLFGRKRSTDKEASSSQKKEKQNKSNFRDKLKNLFKKSD